MEVKCRICGRKVDRDIAYKVVRYGKNEYYCSKKEFENKQKEKEDLANLKDNIFSLINLIFGRVVTNSTLFNEINSLAKIYSYEKIYSYINNNQEMLKRFLNKNFASEYAKIRYFTTIIKNNITDFLEIEEENEVIKNVEFEIPNTKYKPRKKRRSLYEIEMEIEEDG